MGRHGRVYLAGKNWSHAHSALDPCTTIRAAGAAASVRGDVRDAVVDMTKGWPLDISIQLDITRGVGRTPRDDEALRWFRALGDDTRLRLVDLLRDGEHCVCDLTDALEAGQSRLSFHLKTLKDAGLVTDRRQGRWIYYALNPKTIDAVDQFIKDLRGSSARLRPVRKCCD